MVGGGPDLLPLIDNFNAYTNHVWQHTVRIMGGGEGLGVSCFSASSCVAVGTDGLSSIALTSRRLFGSWRVDQVPEGVAHLTSISCATSLDCVAVGSTFPNSAIVMTTDGGATWSEVDQPPFTTLVSVSCPTPSRCMAMGYPLATYNGPQMFTTTDGGQSWTRTQLDGVIDGEALNVDCTSSEHCVLLGPDVPPPTANGYYTDDFGASWNTSVTPGVFAGFGMTCTPTGHCVAVGPQFLVSTDGGMTWASESQEIPYLVSVSCPSDNACVTVGGIDNLPGLAYASSDGGQTWQALALPSSTLSLTSVACPSVSMCVAGGAPSVDGSTIVVTQDGGTTWTAESTPVGTAVDAVACPGIDECIASAGSDILIRH
jgi:photosystem II stability/assembly factor-like uncharacterized protein